MSELFDKEVNAQKESLQKLPVFTQAPTSPQKVCDENETKKQEKRQVPKIFFDGRKEFISHVWKTGVMDIKRLQVTDSSYIEGTICLVTE